MKKWLAMVVVACLAGSASAAEYSWWGNGFGGDGVDFNSTSNWASPWATQASVLPGGNDFVRIQATSWMSGYPVLSGSATVGGIVMGLDNVDHIPGASLTIEAGASLTTVTNNSVAIPENFGIHIGWYSDASITSAGTVDTGAGGATRLSLGSAGNGFGNANLTITDGSWTTDAVVFGSSNSVNTIQVDGGTLTAGDIFFDPASNGINHVQIDGGTVEILAQSIGHLEKPNQTIDITGGTLLLHTVDDFAGFAGLIDLFKTVGLTGYGSGDNIAYTYTDTDADGTNDLFTVTATVPATAEYQWWGIGNGGDGVTWNSASNWTAPWATPVTTVPGITDNVRIHGSSWVSSFPTLSVSANIGGLYMGLDSTATAQTTTLDIAAAGSLTLNAYDGWNDGVQIGFYSDSIITSAGTVDTGAGWTDLGKGDVGNGYGNATLNITGGTWDTANLAFNNTSTNHVQLAGGTMTTWGVSGLHEANQTMDITGGTLLFHSTDTNWFGWIKTLGMTGYGDSDNLVGVHDGNTWTVTAVSPSTITIYDADWANARTWWGDDPTGITSTFDGGVDDVATDPGYDFTCTASNWMIFGLDNAIFGAGNIVPASALPGVWEVTVENTGTESITVAQSGITNEWGAGFWKDDLNAVTLAPGQKATMSADLSAATSIEGLSLTYATLTAGAPAAMSAKVTEPDAPIPPVVDLNLLDAHWATATEWWGDDTGGITNTFDGGVNVPGDPGYEFTCTIGGGWGVLFGVDSADIGTLTPGVWNVWVKNTSANEISVGVAAYRDGGTFDNGGGGGIGIAPGVTKKVSFDLSAATSIEELALSISSAVLGEVTFQVVEELIPASKVILTDADWASAAGMWGDGASTFDGGADIAGDPGYDFTCTTYGWGMLFGVNMGGITGETWEVTLENTGSITNSVEQYIVTVAGNHVKGGVIVALAPGEVVTMTANLSTNGPIDTLGLFFVGPADGDTVATAAIAAPLTASEKYALWAADYPGMGGLNDDDENGGLGDGMDNLFEYAVGGDPLVDDAAALIPVSTFLDADTWLYIYRRRNDAAARGLTYDLQFKSDLIYDLDWASTLGLGEVGSDTTDPDFDVVTNSIPTVMDLSGTEGFEAWVWDETLFLNLEITENF